MFGSFKEEVQTPHYGVTKPLQSWNPVYANIAHYLDLMRCVKKARSARDGLRILFNPPGWLPDYLGGFQTPAEVGEGYRKYDARPAALPMQVYILVQFVASLLVNAFYFFNSRDFSDWPKIGFAFWIVATSVMFGWLLEKRSAWLPLLEGVRLLSLPLGVYLLEGQGLVLPVGAFPVAVGFAALSLPAFYFARHSLKAAFQN
jgi:hypothetical protein